jgi:hypothetical protein
MRRWTTAERIWWVSLIAGAPSPDAADMAAFVDAKLRAQEGRSASIADRNKERGQAERSDLTKAVQHVRGTLPLDGHNAAKVLLNRIGKAVRRGELSSTLTSSAGKEPSIRMLRSVAMSIHATELVAPELASAPEPIFAIHYSSIASSS